jgi:hypothetical protein
VYSSDGEMLFKQDSYFFYLFGVTEDSWFGSVDLRTGRSTLYMPRLPESYAVWMGPLKRCEPSWLYQRVTPLNHSSAWGVITLLQSSYLCDDVRCGRGAVRGRNGGSSPWLRNHPPPLAQGVELGHLFTSDLGCSDHLSVSLGPDRMSPLPSSPPTIICAG